MKAAFDSVDRDVLWLLLQAIGVPSKYLNILRDLYTDNTSRVRADGCLSDSFPTTSGVRQGCVAAPNLFNVAIDRWLAVTTDRCSSLGVDFHSRFVDLCYADDVVLFASLIDTLADALAVMNEEASPLGLSINWAKTKIQSLSDFLPPLPSSVVVNNEQVEVVDDFIYLGARVSSSCSSEPEILRRIGLARRTFGRLSRVWRCNKVRPITKVRILNTCVLPVLLYGCETWCLSAYTASRLDAYHRSCLRHIYNIRWFHRVTNEDLYTRAGISTRLTTTIRQRRIRYLGHVARLDSETPARQILAASARSPPSGWRRPPGRPRLSWVAQVQAAQPIADLIDIAQDRPAFRDLVATVT